MMQSKDMSSNNILSDWALKCRSLASIRLREKKQSMFYARQLITWDVYSGSSPSNTREWVRYEWPACRWQITVSSLMLLQGQEMPSTGKILCSLLWEYSSHFKRQSSKKYLFTHGFRSEKRMSSSEMLPLRASLAAKSAAKFPLMLTQPGAQTPSLPSLVNSKCSSISLIDEVGHVSC